MKIGVNKNKELRAPQCEKSSKSALSCGSRAKSRSILRAAFERERATALAGDTPQPRLAETFGFMALLLQLFDSPVEDQSRLLLASGPIKMWRFIFTHTSGPVPRHAVLGVGGVQ